MENIFLLILMIISEILILGLFIFLKKEKKSQLKNAFSSFLLCLFIWTFCSIFQLLFQNTNIDPFFWEKLCSFAIVLSPVAFLALSQVFAKSKVNIKPYHLLLLVIPIISVIMIFTNEFHHLYYKHYSTNMSELVPGNYFFVHSLYTYLLYGIGIFYLLKYSIKNSGFFSKQSLLITLGTAVPLIVNILGTFGIIEVPMCITSISFSFLAFCFAIAIFKFKFISLTPIALQKIVDRISDSYFVLNEDNIITDFNATFLTTFNINEANVRNVNITDLISYFHETSVNIDQLLIMLNKIKSSHETLHFEKHFSSIDKYFNIEINTIDSNGKYIGTLILFKDITQHIEDMNTIKENQNMLMEKERLASLGQLVGGIAHNLKTPIMSIAGAAEGLTDLVKEYDSSIGDPEVNEQDHHDIAHDMNDWIEKIKTHTSYMSDIITAVKGQAVTLSESEQDSFTIEELIKRVNILMKHELKNALIDMNIKMKTDDMITLNGNVNSLVQVINNMISNAIQSYNGKTNEFIDLIVNKDNSNIIISVQDHGCGMSDEVKNKLFREMITTKGKNGTGLGMFMSYSTIRGHFNGNITFDSKVGEGTTFNIILPV